MKIYQYTKKPSDKKYQKAFFYVSLAFKPPELSVHLFIEI